jgi:SOUL heme-binding protein
MPGRPAQRACGEGLRFGEEHHRQGQFAEHGAGGGKVDAALLQFGNGFGPIDRADRRMAVVTFSGNAKDKDIAKQQAALEGFITTQKLKILGTAQFANNDPPFKPGFLWRNEVMIPVCWQLGNSRTKPDSASCPEPSARGHASASGDNFPDS